MNILLLGSKGAIGSRYAAVLKYLKIPFEGVDYNESTSGSFTHGVIATPTSTHDYCFEDLVARGIKRILIEKPMFHSLDSYDSCRKIINKNNIDVRMVCNYKFIDGYEGETYYDHFNAGKEEDWCNWIQLIGLARGTITLLKESPIWKCILNGRELTLEDIAKSYIFMIQRWLKDPSRLVGIEEAKTWHQKAMDWEKQKLQWESSREYRVGDFQIKSFMSSDQA